MGAPAAYPLEQLQPSAPPPRGTPAGLLAVAQAEAQRIRDLARAEGHAEGLSQGRAEGLVATQAATQALQAALTALGEQSQELAQAIERDAVELALALAAKILAGALEAEPQRVLNVVAGALRRVGDRRSITILVDPADLELVEGAVGELRAEAGGIELCEVQADRRVRRGGAIVRTRESEVDASVATQLERAREVIRAELGDDDEMDPAPAGTSASDALASSQPAGDTPAAGDLAATVDATAIEEPGP